MLKTRVKPTDFCTQVLLGPDPNDLQKTLPPEKYHKHKAGNEHDLVRGFRFPSS